MNAVGLDVTIEDVSDAHRRARAPGPAVAHHSAARCRRQTSRRSSYFRLVHTTVRDIPVTISRTGYTGDLGYELWVDADRAVALWDALMEGGQGYGITPAGIWALDIARIEAGLVMLDVDYYSAHHALIEDQKSFPDEINLAWTVNLDKGPYNGRRALRKARAKKQAWAFVGIEVQWDSLERLYAKRGLPPHLPNVAWRTSAPVLSRRRADRLRDERLLVAAAQAIAGARAHSGAALRARHARARSR